MNRAEKKYRVESFANILQRLKEVGAKPGPEEVSTHYYANQPGNDVVKLVVKDGHSEIHILKESEGDSHLQNITLWRALRLD